MLCIFCSGNTKVTNSRPQKRSNSVWRRRECLDCHTVFTSNEGLDLSGSIVVKTDDAFESFSRDKLFVSVYESLKHRKTALTDATALTDTIIRRLLATITKPALEKPQITQITCSVLGSFDSSAAIQYKAFHPLD